MMAMKFRSRYSEMKPVESNPGVRMKVVYELALDDKGARRIKPTGTTDLQAAIDAEYPSVDLYMVLERLKNGDAEALNRAEAFYADVSEMPVTLQQLMEMNEKGYKIFQSMPDEYKRIYGNDYMQFLYDPGRMVEEIEKRKKAAEPVEEVIANDHEEQ